ncbi:hypothetical protein Tco_0542640 [Tanacetum coccineum]
MAYSSSSLSDVELSSSLDSFLAFKAIDLLCSLFLLTYSSLALEELSLDHMETKLYDQRILERICGLFRAERISAKGEKIMGKSSVFIGQTVGAYADKRRKPLEFSIDDYVLLKMSPLKVGSVAYRLDLPEEFNGVHDMFHVSNLKKCLADPTLQVPLDEIRVDAKINFIEEPVEILEREFKKLKRSRIAIVKFGEIRNVALNSRGNVKIR